MKIDKILDLFDLRPIEKEVFRVCFDADGVGASEIAKKVGINRTSTYDFLDKLVKIGLVVESQKQGIKTFYSQKPEQIELLINEKKQKITIATQVIGEFKKDFYTNAKRTIPRMQIYEGKEELRQMMKDMLLYHDLTVYSFWPIKNIIQTLGKEFYSDFHKKRVTSNLHIKVLWPKKHSNLREKHFFLKDSEKFKREIRTIPENIDFDLGYTIYGNTVRFMSSQKENYGFIIESAEMADTMKKQFEMIWKISKPLKNKKI